MLDLNQAEDLIAKLRRPAVDLSRSNQHRRPPPPVADPTQVSGRFAEEPGWYEQASTAGLVTAAIAAFAAWTGNDS
jgi:hypothetical protein